MFELPLVVAVLVSRGATGAMSGGLSRNLDYHLSLFGQETLTKKPRFGLV